MSEIKKKDIKETVNQADSANQLKDSELEDVSGGLFGITIIDNCEKRFDPYICFAALWGQCPRLIIEDKKYLFTIGKRTDYKYIFSCSKGCFSKQEYVYCDYEK